VPGWQEATHVAVDRWTGGAADGMLHTVLEPHGMAWEPLRLDVDLARLGEDRQPAAAITLLLYALAGLAAGTVPLGKGGTRGLGAVRVESVDIAAGEGVTALPAGWAPRSVSLNGGGDQAGDRAAVLALARELWPGGAEGWTRHLGIETQGGPSR
jgi:hypothetical protein